MPNNLKKKGKMNMKLYEINDAILECLDEETGEIIDFEKFEQLQIEKSAKIESLALWYKNELADAEALKKEKEIFAQREKVAKNKAEQLKQRLDYELAGDTFKTDKVLISYRKSVSVFVDEGAELPEKYLTFKQPEPNKTAIKDALKSGIEIHGCSLSENQNIQIK